MKENFFVISDIHGHFSELEKILQYWDESSKFAFVLGGCVLEHCLCFFVVFYFVMEHLIINETCTAEAVCEVFFLIFGWV